MRFLSVKQQIGRVANLCTWRVARFTQLAIMLFILPTTFAASASKMSADAANEGDSDVEIRLGQRLFFDTSLSRDGRTSCATCHRSENYFADERSLSRGVDGAIGTRNAPSLLNAIRHSTFFWDGRRASLEELVLDPITNPIEMGLRDGVELCSRLRGQPTSVAAFVQAYPGPGTAITPDHVRASLSAYVRSLGSGRNAYDRYRGDPKRYPLEHEARQGLDLFAGKAGCSACHRLDGTPATFADDSYHHSDIGRVQIERHLPALTSTVREENLQGEALGRRVAADAHWAALGRFVVTHDPKDIGAIRTPSLRNVAVTAPYMHDGSIATLADAVNIEIYYRGISRTHPTILTADEQKALLAFLSALTDTQ